MNPKPYIRLGRRALSFVIVSVLFLIAASNALADSARSASLIVKMAGGLTAAEQAAVLARNGGIETSSIPALRLRVVRVPAAEAAAVQSKYQADPQVERVEINQKRKAEGAPADPLFYSQWGLRKIGWDSVFGSSAPTGTAVVAVLDTGVDASHPDLGGAVISGASIVDGSDGRTDPNGHGTWMAGIIAAAPDNGIGIAGVAYAGVKIMPVTVLGPDGTGQDSDIISGILYAADRGADVILMAFGNPGQSPALQEAVNYAWSKNCVLVAAAGNDASAVPAYPAGGPGVIGVSATDPGDGLTTISNHGTAFLAAPGMTILTTDLRQSYATISGTSAASAIVSGVAAFMKASDMTLSNGIIAGRLARTADPAGTTAQTGNGRVNMARALSDPGADPVAPLGAFGGPILGPYRQAQP